MWFSVQNVFETFLISRNIQRDIIINVRRSLCTVSVIVGRSQWPRGLRRRSTAARPLRLWVRIPPGACMVVCCECCALSGRGLCDGLITRPQESYRQWRVVVCDQENSRMRRLKPAVENTTKRAVTPGKQTNKQPVIVDGFNETWIFSTFLTF